MLLRIQRLSPQAVLPSRGSLGSAGLDIYALEDTWIPSALHDRDVRRVLVSTGLAVEIPPGWFGMIAPRSGLAFKHGLSLANPPGIIDSDYRGELKIALSNFGSHGFQVDKHMRVAQLLLVPYLHASIEEVQEIEDTKRGAGGFGSTGHA